MALDLGGVILARHGETNDNLPPGRFQGWTDTPLNDLGRRQAVGAGPVAGRPPGADRLAVGVGPEPRPGDRLDRRRGHRAAPGAGLAAARGQPGPLGGLPV